ncbi:MAG: hypothetical protein J6A25_04470 [Lachnospiraceae bacterium]|nr:hypothetical protein [Lachnospiraceae bacterium]
MTGKVKLINSIRTRLVAIIVIMCILSGVGMLLIVVPKVKDEYSKTNGHYIEDLAISYGSMVEYQVEENGAEAVLKFEVLDHDLSHAHLEGIESSYAYVVSPDGIMVYHPTPEKIGQPVENAAVKQTVETLKSGKDVKNEVIEYEFKGEDKFAGIYVDEGKNFILVVTADRLRLWRLSIILPM